MAEEFVQFIGLNPSTADENVDDPTLRRCQDFTKRWGYGAMCMTNLFAFRATQPRVMKIQQDPLGPDNLQHVFAVVREAKLIIAAWGRDGNHIREVSEQVIGGIRDLGAQIHHLGLNDDGTPKHPLYLKATTVPVLWG